MSGGIVFLALKQENKVKFNDISFLDLNTQQTTKFKPERKSLKA